MYEIFNKGIEIPDFKKCITTPIPSMKNAKRMPTVSHANLVSHASKIITNILLHRIEDKINDIQGDDQFVLIRAFDIK